MPENVSYIPNRIKNASKGGHVTGAEDIIDDNFGETQASINADTYRKSETYNKDEIDNVISNTPETDVVVLDVEEGSTALDTLNEVPLADRPNKLFRVRNDSNTHYDEYGWTGTVWGLLASKDYGIDDEPTNTDNLPKSSGILKVYGRYVNNHQGYIDVFADKEGRIYMAFLENGEAYIPGLGQEYKVDYMDRVEILLDKSGKIISSRSKDGTLSEYAINVIKLHAEDVDLGEDAISYIRNLISGVGGEVMVDPDGWDMLTEENQKLAVEKSDSLFVPWTPKKAVPKRWNDLEYYPAGEEVLGIPYGATYETDKTVGFDVSLETFMTAVNNPYSLLYTENVSGVNSASIWGFTYHGVTADGGYSGPYFANVCSTLTSYCIGLPEDFKSRDYPWMNKVGILGKVLPQNSQGVKIGDVIHKSGHCALVRNIKRKENGSVESIIVSEQAGEHPRQTEYSAEEFDSVRIVDANATIYRLPDLNPDMEMFSFNADSYVYNNDICTFAGNNACFREGQFVVINYNLTDSPSHNWTAIELYKNDTLVNTYQIEDIDQSELPEGQRGHALKITGLEYGDYKARMTDGSNFSEYTFFKVIETQVTASIIEEGGEWNAIEVEYASNNAVPVSVKVVYTNGNVHGFYILNDEDVTKGRVVIPKEYLDGQPAKIKTGVTYFLKVYFKTDAGRVTNEAIALEF